MKASQRSELLQEADYSPEEDYIPAQRPKGIEVDDVEYEPGYGVTADWALSFYQEVGGEG